VVERIAVVCPLQLNRVQEDMESDKNGALEALREQAAAEQAEAMEELQSESERLLESIEAAMARVMADKKNTDAALAKTRVALEEAEDMNYDLEQRAKKLERTAKLQSMQLLRQMLVYINEINKCVPVAAVGTSSWVVLCFCPCFALLSPPPLAHPLFTLLCAVA